MTPIVSIVIPCYNQAQYLDELLRSIVRQSVEQWEAIVVDDCSTNGDIAAVVRSFNDDRIRVIRHLANQGLGAARNTGFREAQAELVLPIDSDDMLTSRFLESTLAALSRDPSASCVFTDFQLFGQSTQIWHFGVKSPTEMLHIQWAPGPGVLMRKSLWQCLGGYDELKPPYHGNEDWDFWIGAVQRGVRPIHIPEPLYLYRRTASAMSVTTLMYFDYYSREIIYRRHRNFFDEHRAGRTFRAEGYLRSADASLRRGRRLRSAWLASRGLCLDPSKIELYRQLALALTPTAVQVLVRNCKRGFGFRI